MLDCEKYRDFMSGKRQNTSTERTTSENGSIEENVTGKSSENVKGEVSDNQALTQEAVNEQIKGFSASLARGIDSALAGSNETLHLSHHPKADFGTLSGAATYQSNTMRIKFDIQWAGTNYAFEYGIKPPFSK